ncbi:MAG: trypsin-like peptidase domain-containing protein [Patescibacteria group bacterium]|nr:trypsin-like peptidase domain-containing protein [Patescibacteria group bacterium]
MRQRLLSPPRLPYFLVTLILAAALAWSATAAAQADTPPAAVAPVAAPANLEELKKIQGQIRQVVERVIPATVGTQIGASRGSGVIVSEGGLVLTAGPVVGQPGQEVLFTLHDGKTVKGKTLGMFSTADAGMMQITDEGKWPFVEPGRSAALVPGSWCVAVGHPLGHRAGRPPVIRVGRVLRMADMTIQSDCPLVGGDSGGPVFDLDGKVIGINSRIGGAMSMNFHVPIDIFHENWDRLAAGESWALAVPQRDGDDVKAALREAVNTTAPCVVRVKHDGKPVALGTIVGPHGWVVTKASELGEKQVVCVLPDAKEFDARVVGVDSQFDIAMLKIEANDLPAIAWEMQSPEVGHWVATPGPEPEPLALGVISVPRLSIPGTSGVLGVRLGDDNNGAMVESVVPEAPAEKAGLQAGDIITHVDGKETATRDELIHAIRTYRPGVKVTITIQRGEQRLEIVIQLASPSTPDHQRREQMNRLGVGVSGRRDDFPMVLQHDSVLNPTDCGGPLVNLDGRAVGVNIARGGRVETYAIPADVLVPRMYELMSGRLDPARQAKPAQPADLQPETADAGKKAAEEAARKAAAEKAEAEKKEAEKAAAEKMAADKATAEKAEADKKAAEEAARKAEAEKMEAEKAAAAKAEAEKKAAEEAARKAEAEKKEAEKVESEPAAPKPQ